jgi:hypothetical protein
VVSALLEVVSPLLLAVLAGFLPTAGALLDERPKRRAAERAAAAADPAPAKLYGWHTTREGAMKCPVCKKGLEKPKPQVPEMPVRQAAYPGAVMDYGRFAERAPYHNIYGDCHLECCS